MCAAASIGVRTPLRLAGDASARTLGLTLGWIVGVGIGGLLEVAQHRVGQPFAREEDKADADADRRLDRLQADAEREPARVRDVVTDERRRDRDLHDADVARPE